MPTPVPMFCMWCNTPFDPRGQPMCSCAITNAARDVDRRMTADRLLDQRLTQLEQRIRALEHHVCPAKPAAPLDEIRRELQRINPKLPADRNDDPFGGAIPLVKG